MQAVDDSKESLYSFGRFQLDAERRTLERDGQPVSLTPKRFDLLLYLVRNRSRIVEKEELMAAVWHNTFVEEGNLSHNRSVIGKTLGEKAGEHRFIITIPSQGYRLIADVIENRSQNDETIIIERTRSRFVFEVKTDEPSLHGEEVAADRTSFALAKPSALTFPRVISGRKTTVIYAALIVSLVAIPIIRYFLTVEPQREPFPRININRLTINRLTTAGRAAHTMISPDGKCLAYVVKESQGQSLWVRHRASSNTVCVVQPSAAQIWGGTFCRIAYEAGVFNIESSAVAYICNAL